jgi:hypothetical protein
MLIGEIYFTKLKKGSFFGLDGVLDIIDILRRLDLTTFKKF